MTNSINPYNQVAAGYGNLFDTQSAGAAGDTKKSQSFAGTLDGMLTALSKRGPQPEAQRGTVSQGFGYIVPMIMQNGGEEGAFGSYEYDEFADAEPLGYNYSDAFWAMARSGAYRPNAAAALSQAQQLSLTEDSVYVGAPNERAALNRAIIDSFNVESNPRYLPTPTSTACNLYVADVSAALGAAVPRRVDVATGTPITENTDTTGMNVSYQNANRMNGWLNQHGSSYGWVEVSGAQAQYMANQGFVAVASWENTSGGHGHIQLVSPSTNDVYDKQTGVAIAQAGSKVVNYGYISNIYSDKAMEKVQYFVNTAS